MAMRIPQKYRLPPEMEDAMLTEELGYPPEVFRMWPQAFIERLLIYKGVKHVATFGGEWQP